MSEATYSDQDVADGVTDPDVQSQDADADDSVEVDGEKMSKAELIRRAANERKLVGEYTRKSQELAELRGRVDELSRRQVAPTPQAVAAQAQPTAQEPDWEAIIAGIDMYAEGGKAELAKVLKQQAAWSEYKVRQMLNASQQQQQQQMSEVEQKRAIDAENERLFNERLNDKTLCPVELTKEEREELFEDFHAHVGKRYGEYIPTAKAFRRNDRAIESALMSVPSVRDKIRAFDRAKAREEGLRAAQKGQEATRSGPGRTPTPLGRGATYEQTVEWLRNQSPETRREFIEKSHKFREEYISRQGTVGRG